ncbi:hypothetical protein M2163_000723 [Streptomyces sp. SAI-135]|jgi:hypothetical protein|uniref:hypothetical protein n=1 Tax=unclassified Streptomyces TaxID=2593676 RepID=UPI002474591E|nr:MULTISPECIES: hypothetical protein [unclassified Streptomyces]MDH6522770.1 hypothetical protein [Streptomyces sp. SAI-090]MDH6554391.1 hypothetical protein [Streptomyces sp. SAI-041]MDH6573657.1 hypothetical protein [Streptomyces sp. SAI-117]MDH6581610.1 hypothetical protein [Streptomyces sp. SAI-133]MDH6613615.1 hypothetical protein [Streptomyces sp. SAI-135]
MNVQDGSRTVHVVRTMDSEVEVFSSAAEARQYARCKRGATVLERTVRGSLGEAQTVYERRVHIVDGVVRRDTSTEELLFTVDGDTWVQAADVESFQAKGNWWTIVGLGTDRQTLDDLIMREISRLTSAWLLRRRTLA